MVFPQKADVTLTGFRLRIPPLGIDIHPKIQNIHLYDAQGQLIAPRPGV